MYVSRLGCQMPATSVRAGTLVPMDGGGRQELLWRFYGNVVISPEYTTFMFFIYNSPVPSPYTT